jgi:Predicted aminopeptidases
MKFSTNSLRFCGSTALWVVGVVSALCGQSQKLSPSSTPTSSSATTAPKSASAMPEADRENFSPELIRQLGAIKTAALSDDYAYQQLAHLTENIGARPAGSAGARVAVEYVAAQMRSLGLEVHLEEIKVRHWVRGTETAELVAGSGFAAGIQQKIVVTALGGSTSTGNEGITAEVVVVNDFDQLKTLSRDKVAGKFVLFNKKFDKQKADSGLAFVAYRETVSYRETGPKAAADLGALAVVVRSIGGAEYRLAHTGDSDAAGIPAAAITAEDADLIAHLAAQGPVRMHLTLTPKREPDETSYNVIGDLRGTEHPEQIVIVSGHLDSWDLGTGALDDGAGVVMAMETAQLIQQLHLRPKRTLRVIAWMDEETDGAGSKRYKQEHQSEFPNHVAAIESDAGAPHPFGFFTRISRPAAEALRPVQSVLVSIGASTLQESLHPPGVTDIAPMVEDGVPVLGIMQDSRTYYDYHHTAADTLDKVVPSELRENAAAMAVMAFALTNMKDPLPR